jgi:hypothetical protein
MRRTILLAVALSAVFASSAGAHNISINRTVGDVNTPFIVNGTAWGPGQFVSWQYYFSASASRPLQSGSFRENSSAAFRFTLRATSPSDASVMQKICFSQFDTRVGRTFRHCTRFFLQGPTAHFEPATGTRADRFLLVIEHFPAGATVRVEQTRADGSTTGTTVTTLRRAHMVNPSTGPRYAQVGEAGVVYRPTSNDTLGVYPAFIHLPGRTKGPRAAFRITG